MKKLIFVILLGFHFGTWADMHLSHNSNDKGFFNIHFGMEIDAQNLSVTGFPLSLGYGRNIPSQDGYLGFFEVGLGFPDTFFVFKYGYEFMRDSLFSFGLDVSVLLGALWNEERDDSGRSSRSLNEERDDSERSLRSLNLDLAFGNSLGFFVKARITDSVSVLVRAGAKHETAFKNLEGINVNSYVDVGFRYYL